MDSSPAPSENDPGDEYIPFAPISVDALAPLFPGLHVEKLIATGGMGGVYLARQLSLDRAVALKILPPVDGLEENTAARFAGEARLMAQLAHPNIVGIYDFGKAGDLYYFIMELVRGATFHELIQSGKIDSSNATQLMVPICAGVSYAHKRHVLHHDLKPGNLMLSDEHVAKLLDFGLAGIFKPGHRDANAATWGSADYAAPERFIAEAPIDHRADLYSLGVIYYEMLTGKLPEPGYDPPSKATGMHSKLDEIIGKCLAQNPDDRYPSVEELGIELKRLLKMPRLKSKPSRSLVPVAKAPTRKSTLPASASPKRPAVSAKSPARKPAASLLAASAAVPPSAGTAAPNRSSAPVTTTRPAQDRRGPPPPDREAAQASQRQSQIEWEKRAKAEKKRQDLKTALILLIGGGVAIGLLIFILAN